MLILHSLACGFRQLMPLPGLYLLICTMNMLIVSNTRGYREEDSSRIMYAETLEHGELTNGSCGYSEEGRSPSGGALAWVAQLQTHLEPRFPFQPSLSLYIHNTWNSINKGKENARLSL